LAPPRWRRRSLADIFKCQAERGKTRRVHLNPDRGAAVAADLRQRDTRHLADLLGEKAVEQFIDPR
jgi:hypothetical protein